MKNSAIFILLLFIVLSCADDSLPTPIEECPAPCVEKDTILEVIWRKPIGKGRSSITPVLFENTVLFSSFDLSERETFYMRNKSTGELIWEWSEPDHYRTISPINYKDQYFLFCDLSGPLIVLDVSDGTEIWRDNLKGNYSGSVIGVNNDFVYYVHNDAPRLKTESHLVRAKIDEWKWDTLYSEYKTANNFPDLYPPATWRNNQGEEILLFQSRGFDGADIMAYHVDAKRLLWKHDSITDSGSIINPTVREDLFYFIGEDDLFCYDIPTGNQVWKLDLKNHETGESLFDTKLHFYKDKILFESRIARYAVDAKTGTILWKRGGLGSSQDKLFGCDGQTAFHNGVFYLACTHEIYALDAETGETLWIEDTLGYSFLTGITVDPATGYLYAANTEYVWCLKVKK